MNLALWSLLLLAAPVPSTMQWELVDVVSRRTFTVAEDPAHVLRGGRQESVPEGSGLRLGTTWADGRVKVRLTEESGADRGLVLRLRLRGAAGAWRWWHDLDTSEPLGDDLRSNTVGLQELPGLPEFGESQRPDYGRYSVYPAGAIQHEAGWLAIGRPPGQLAVVRFAAGGSPVSLTAEVDLALTALSRTPRTAELELHVLAGDGQRGLRQALAQLAERVPQPVRAKRFGGWMPFWDLARIDNVDEFGFAYQEGAPNPSFDDALGVDSFVYFHCAGVFANVPGYVRGSGKLPPYETLRGVFNAAAREQVGEDGVWDRCGVRGPDQQIVFRPEGVYGDFFSQGCVNPALPYGRLMAERLVQRVQATPSPTGIDGCYYDGIAAGLTYGAEHLKAANHLLLWDTRRNCPVSYNLLGSCEWARAIHERFAGTGKLTMLNDSSLVSFNFAAPWIDVPGAEMDIRLTRSEARAIRAICGRRPFCTLAKADWRQVSQPVIETYLRRCVAYGFLPGFFDISPSGANPHTSYWEHPEWYHRDRALFRRYLPLAAELAAAGWQADPLASAAGAAVERFGPAGDLTYLTVSTDPGTEHGARPVTVRLDPALVQPGQLAVELLTGRVEPVTPVLTMSLTADDLAIWALGTPAAQQAAVARRSRAVVDRLLRYQQALRGRDRQLTPWTSYAGEAATVVAPGRQGGHCLKMERRDAKQPAGVNQTLTVAQQPKAVRVSAWSKAEGVSGASDRDYALYVDIYYTDGSAKYGNTATFATGTHDWQRVELTITPDKPVRNINVYLLLRGSHTGVAWFDDVSVVDPAQADRELLLRGNFEAPAGSALGAQTWQQRTPDRALLQSVADGLPAGADRDRLLRDVAELAWHDSLLPSLQAGAARAARPSRLTSFEAIPEPRGARGSGPLQFVAQGGKLPVGTVVAVDSNFAGYTPAPLCDGLINPGGTDWANEAWASAEGGPHWIELRFPRPIKIRRLRLWWARDGKVLYVSRTVVVQAKNRRNWQPVAGQRHLAERPELTVITLPSPQVTELRIHQPQGGGSAERPNLMWVSEVEVDAE